MIIHSLTISQTESEAVNSIDWNKDFKILPDQLSTTGANDYFNLTPGYQLRLEGKEDGKDVILLITVLNETKIVDGYETRIVEEKESKDGEIIEISTNYFAIDKELKDVYYFGEEVDIYKNGEIVAHEGAWESGKEGAKFGLMMPGEIVIGEKYYQEIAPEIAMDRAEIVSNTETLKTPAGNFENCLKIKETTPLEPGSKEYKLYSPGIGLIKDGPLLLVKHTFIQQ